MQIDRLLFPGYRKTQINQPVFIVGNARSGTTLFQRLLCGDEERFVYFRGWEVLFPSLIQKKSIRALSIIITKVTPQFARWLAEWEEKQFQEIKKIRPTGWDKPEEDEFLLLISFASSVLNVLFPYSEPLNYLNSFDQRPAKTRKGIMRFYRECVLRQLYFHGSTRTLVSKNPAFITKMRSLAEEFPDAKFVYTMRNPFETIPSLLKLMSTTWEQIGIRSSHADNSIHEFARGSIRDYNNAMEMLAELPDDRYAIVEYTDLTADPKATVEKVYQKLNLSISPKFRRKLGNERKRQKRFQSFNIYSLEEFGLSEDYINEGLSGIMDRFGYRLDDVSANEAKEML